MDMEHVKLPPARALREGSRLAPHPRGPRFSTRISYATRRLKPAGETVVSHLFGLFPLFAIVALAVGLVWGSAMGASP
jgi:hypothetical protein